MKPRTILTLAIVALLTLISATLHRTPAQLKVISYNIRLSTGKDGPNSWQHRKNATLTMIRSEQPTASSIAAWLDDMAIMRFGGESVSILV